MLKQNRSALRLVGFLTVLSTLTAAAQGIRLRHGTFIASEDLPGEFALSLKKMGSRLMSADKAAIGVAGTLTDDSGTRQVRITVQAPGYLRFQDDGNSDVIAYDGTSWRNTKSSGGDARIEESLLASFPDAVLLQIASGAGLRRIGGRFRTDDGKTPNYSGPYWTLYEFAPPAHPGLAPGQALQQSQFVALDEKTWLISEVRRVEGSKAAPQVTQTKFNNWFEQDGQWYPGEIVRFEQGKQALKLSIHQASTGSQLATSVFQP
jgi:hypothetical protein